MEQSRVFGKGYAGPEGNLSTFGVGLHQGVKPAPLRVTQGGIESFEIRSQGGDLVLHRTGMLSQIVPASDSKADAPVDQGAAGLGQGRTGLGQARAKGLTEAGPTLAETCGSLVDRGVGFRIRSWDDLGEHAGPMQDQVATLRPDFEAFYGALDNAQRGRLHALIQPYAKRR